MAEGAALFASEQGFWRVAVRSGAEVWRAAVGLVFPPLCVACGGRHDHDATPLCQACRDGLRLLDEWCCPRCGLGLGPFAAGKPACPAHHEGLLFRGATAVCRYHGTAADVVKALKFGRDLRALEVMAPLLAERVARAAFAQGIEVVLPVPLHWARRMARRFNQSELLAERVGERLRVEVEPKAIKRLRYTTPQSMLAGREREENLKGAFAVRGRAAVKGARVLLVDDVMTSCATARECARALLDAEARSVDVAVFAR